MSRRPNENEPSKPKRQPKKRASQRGVGRPSLYRAEFAEQARKLCRLGATDREIADFFGVNVDTIQQWKKVHREFSDSLKDGKELADSEVADRLFKRATGYSHKDTKFATHEGKITDREEYTRHYPPDTIACIFWLKNRRPDLWRDKVGLVHTGATGGPMQMEGDFRPSAEDEEVIRRIAETRARIQQPQAADGGSEDA